MIAGLQTADFVVLMVYLIGTTALGIWAGRGAKSIAEFFMPRRFGITMMIMSAFGAGTASDQAVTVASGTFRNGISGIWYQWSWLVATPFYWLIAPIFRRLRAVTTADVYELRFDRSVAILFSIVGIVNMTIKIGLMLKGTGALVESGTGTQVNEDLAIAVTAGLFVLYGVAGGLAAAIVTDFVQGILTVVFSVILLPFVLTAVGGIDGIKETITDPKMLSLVAPGEISLFFIIMFGTQALVGIVAQPYIMGVCAAGKTEFEGRVGFMCGNFIKRFCTIAWSLTAIAAVAWYIQQGRDLSTIKPDNVYGDMAQAFLPNAMPGLLGLFMASMLAGVMSSCDCFMISAAGLFTQNVYKHMVTGRPESHYLWVGRLVSVLVVAGGIGFALWVPTVIEALEIWFKVAPMIGIAFWLALFWRPMNVAGAWASAMVVLGMWALTEWPPFIEWVASLPNADAWRLVWVKKGVKEIYEPWAIVSYMGAAAITGIVVSLFTKPVAREKLDLFYALTRTPIYPGEKVLAPCTLPIGVTPPDRPMLVTAFGLEVPMPSRISVIGFTAGWALTTALVAGFVLLFR